MKTRIPVVQKRGRKGNAMLELALGITSMALLAVGAGDFSQLFYNAIELESAAHAGAMFGSMSASNATNTTAIQNVITANAPNLTGVTAAASYYYQCSGSGTHYTSSPTCPGGTPMLYVKATASSVWTPSYNYGTVANPMTISRSVTVRAQ
jgi:Flp pilus assembly protein TadG